MIDLPRARARLDRHNDALIKAHENATSTWATMVERHPAFTLPFDSTTRANVMQNHIAREVEIQLDGAPGVIVMDRLNFFAVRFGDDILMRFKYVGSTSGRPSNVATTQQRSLARQEFPDDLMHALGMGSALVPPTLLTCGYTLDGAELGRLEIRCDCKHVATWSYDIFGGESVILPQALPDMGEPAKPARVASRRKVAKGKDAAEAESA